MEQELVSGTIAAVVFENPENGYAVVKLDSDDGGLITVVGTIPAPAAGERLIVTGKWTAHATYGRQLEAEFLERLLPDSTAEIRAYLSSRAVRGVGPKTAEKIVAAFGTDSLKILETAPERLTEIDGISRKKALEIGASFRQQVAVRRLIEFLAGYRIPAQVAVRLYRVYGAQSLGRVQEDPYLLAQPQFGAGFGAADQLALELGFDGDDARRVEAGVIFELRHNLTNGHTFLPQDKLVAATSQLLSLEAEPVIAAVDRLTELGRVEHSTIAGIAAVYLPEYYEAETAIAARIRAMAQHPPAPLPDAERVLQGIEAIEGITYAERQRDAIRMAAERRIMILTGGPGTGKTTVLSGILTLFSKLGRKTLLAAPTGRAAKRLSELTGRDAATVHRLLEAQVSPENGEMFFARNEDEPLECDAVIVDEMSMVDVLLMHSLLEALPQEACLVLVGDPTGIELPEATGRRANPETKKELYDEGHDGWYDADTVAASIGQSENRFTPLQLCSYTAALANRGVRYTATLLKRVLSSDYQKLIRENQPVVASTLNISDEAYAAYSEGMREAVTSGTAYSAFVGYDVAVCAKTGTAQHGSGGSDNASFVLYAPADDPEIAIAVYVEKGAQGGTLGTIARDILTAYFSEAGSTDTVPAENTLN